MCSSGKSAKRWWRRTAGDHHHLGWQFCWRDSDSPRARTNSHPSLYRYDSRGNCIARSLPGAGWTYTVYDKGNRPVLTQDAAQRAQNANAWTFAIPDRLGRPALRGTTTMTVNAFADPYKNTVVQASLPKTPTYSGTYRGYVLSGITLSSPVLLEVDYYDAYGFAGTSPFPAANNADFAYDSSIGTSFSAYYSPSAQGLQTGSLLKVLDNTAGNQYLWSVSYFDDKCRVVQHRASTHLGGVEKDWFLYDFTGNATKRKTEHKPSSGTSLIETATQTYNTWGHPVKTTHKLGSGTAQVVSNRTYDKAGRLATDKRNGTAALKTTFSYNIRSWVTGITGTLFTETLKYQNGTPARWGGDVSQAVWKDDRATQTKTYTFGYDTVGRLTTAAFSDAAGASINFSENVSAYDANGNITGLQRYGRTSASAYGLIDNLAYTYSGNKVTSIKDTGSAAYSSDFRFSNGTNNTYTYSYDASGRLTADSSKGISSITWNVLGLPQTVTFSSGAVINYSYAADGTKLRESRTASSTTTTTDYTGNLVLENGTRSRLLFDGGYMSLSDNAYHYFLTDHLGSVRVVASSAGTAEEYDHYYPLGGPIAKYSTVTSIQPVKYQGKEWGADKGLKLYDFGARRYDPATGRWLSQDPLSEKYYAHSPYLFCAANPMKYVDPTGERIYLLFYTVGNSRGDEMFKAAAETRKYDIEHSRCFNEEQDKVLLTGIQDLSKINEIVETLINNYSEQYGKTIEFSIWSHGSFDGPVGTTETSHYPLDSKQMTLDGWGIIDFNWATKANANFYGCRTGLATRSQEAFSTRISSLDNFENVSVSGQASFSYPSVYTNYRANNQDIIHSRFSYPTYMVGGTHFGLKGHFSPISAKSVPMTTSYNGIVTSTTHYQNGRRR